ncbi:MAG: zf-HC2 domain-containing protein [Acidobacteria bacterium]|nr:zf-HC2 domain-containing protein [Acidobacteriota bacterium]MCB9398808.1 zf-HC2 domain-containing protein [Acidobacteriota bacterium]
MSHNHEPFDQQVGDFLDSKLSKSERDAFVQHLNSCSECQGLVQTARDLQARAERWQAEPVPQWERLRYLFPQQKSSGLIWRWALIAACLFLGFASLLQVRVSWESNHFQIAFGPEPTVNPEQVATLIDQALTDYKQQQASALDDQLERTSLEMKLQNEKLLTRVMEQSRKDQREDMALLVSQLQKQRENDVEIMRVNFKTLMQENSRNREGLIALANIVEPKSKY